MFAFHFLNFYKLNLTNKIICRDFNYQKNFILKEMFRERSIEICFGSYGFQSVFENVADASTGLLSY